MILKFQQIHIQDINFLQPDNNRLQSHAWLFDADSEQVRRLSQSLEPITGLLVSRKTLNTLKYFPNESVESEGFQIGLYSPGGFFAPHYDAYASARIKETPPDFYTKITLEFVGDRIATLMIYLSDVEGGSTVFPWIGKASIPEKGSAAFWFNIYPNGDFDPDTLHAACPTIYGLKWVSNKWIRMGAQIWKKKCGINPKQWL